MSLGRILQKKRKGLAKDLFHLLQKAGNSISKDEREEYILTGGLKFSRTYNNSTYSYKVEDCNTYENYYELNNLFILTLIKEYLIRIMRENKIKTNRPVLETEEMLSLLTYKDVEDDILRQHKDKDSKGD